VVSDASAAVKKVLEMVGLTAQLMPPVMPAAASSASAPLARALDSENASIEVFDLAGGQPLSCEVIGKVLFLDGDTIREWHKLYLEDGIEGLATFNHEGGSCRLTVEQQDKLKAWIGAALPRTTREVGAWIANEFDIEYQTRSG
jgi:transposase